MNITINLVRALKATNTVFQTRATLEDLRRKLAESFSENDNSAYERAVDAMLVADGNLREAEGEICDAFIEMVGSNGNLAFAQTYTEMLDHPDECHTVYRAALDFLEKREADAERIGLEHLRAMASGVKALYPDPIVRRDMGEVEDSDLQEWEWLEMELVSVWIEGHEEDRLRFTDLGMGEIIGEIMGKLGLA